MRSFILATALVGSAACNSMLGVGDVELATDAGSTRAPAGDAPTTTPDAAPDRSACKLPARYQSITLTSATSATLTRDDDGSPDMFVEPAPNDGLLITLHDNKGGHGVLDAMGVYQLMAADADPGTCAICLLFGADFDQSTKSFSQFYAPRVKGQLQVSTASTTQLIGSMQDLEFRHVNLDTSTNTTTDNSDHCTVTVDEIDFNLTYSTSVAPSAIRAQLVR